MNDDEMNVDDDGLEEFTDNGNLAEFDDNGNLEEFDDELEEENLPIVSTGFLCSFINFIMCLLHN